MRFQANDTIEDVTLIPTVADYDPSDIISVWGEGSTADKDKERKKQLKYELRQFLLGRQSSDNKNFTTVGLRDKYGARQEDKVKMRDTAWDAVLFQQHLQNLRQYGEDDDEDYIINITKKTLAQRNFSP